MKQTLSRLALLLAAMMPAPAGAQTAPAFAGDGASGSLTLTITVTGEGRAPGPPLGHEALVWKARYTATSTTRLVAMAPVADAGADNTARAGAAVAAGREVLDEKAEEIMDKWNDRIDACDDDEACEARVQAAMLADPEYRRLIAKVQREGAGVLAKADAIDMAPRFQFWRADQLDQFPSSGSIRVDLRHDLFGVPSELGGRVNRSVAWAGGLDLAREAGGLAAVLEIDGRQGTYRLQIPAGITVEARECGSADGRECTGRNTRSLPLLGQSPPRGQTWDAALALTGKAASIDRPTLSGRTSFQANLGTWENPAESFPVDVVIEWTFRPDAGTRR